jgi:hypothetical protein
LHGYLVLHLTNYKNNRDIIDIITPLLNYMKTTQNKFKYKGKINFQVKGRFGVDHLEPIFIWSNL